MTYTKFISFCSSLAPILFVASLSGAQNAAGPCSDLRPVSNALGYKVREANTRCEGLYESTVRAIGLELVGVMLNRSFDFSTDTVQIVGPETASLPPHMNRQIRVRAVALPLKTYYQMDGVLDGSSRLHWPIGDVVKAAGLKPRNLGLYGWIETGGEKTFVPVQIVASDSHNTTSDVITLMFRVSMNAEEIYWRRNEGGVETEWLSVIDSPVSSGKTVFVSLPNGPPSEIRIDVAAKRENSDKWARIQFNVLRVNQ